MDPPPRARRLPNPKAISTRVTIALILDSVTQLSSQKRSIRGNVVDKTISIWRSFFQMSKSWASNPVIYNTSLIFRKAWNRTRMIFSKHISITRIKSCSSRTRLLPSRTNRPARHQGAPTSKSRSLCLSLWTMLLDVAGRAINLRVSPIRYIQKRPRKVKE